MTDCHREILLPGLEAPVEMLFDRWGVPHIYAQTLHDAYFGQGFAAARDRLWQMDIWRRRGLGLLAEAFGPAYLEADRARRLFLYRGSPAVDWAAMGEGIEAMFGAFVAGINAHVALIEAGRAELPEEFVRFGLTPQRWAPDDIVRIRSVGLRSNVAEEFARTRLAAEGALHLEPFRRQQRPDAGPLPPFGFDPADLPADALAVYALATQENPFASMGPVIGEQSMASASNVWALAPARTTTGRPILANDPHRLHGFPSIRWIVHLEAPGLSAIGATEPVHPGVANGHNRDMAFGFTWNACDQEDLILHRDVEPERVTERIPVAGGCDTAVDLAFVDGDPVIWSSPDGRRHLCVRSAFLLPGSAPYCSGVRYHRARNLAEFRRSLRRAGAPVMNYCGADLHGDIGVYVRGAVPQRTVEQGRIPQLAGPASAWSDLIDPDALPSATNPPQGWVANCNQVPMADTFDHGATPVGQEFSDSSRFDRLARLLARKDHHTVEDCIAYQMDQTLDFAALLVARLLAAGPELPPGLADRLAAWDGRMAAGSSEAAFFAVWLERMLKPVLARALLGDQAGMGLDTEAALQHGHDPDLLRQTAQQAVAHISALLGPDCRAWELGRLQTFTLAQTLPGDGGERILCGPLPLGGHLQTLNKAATDAQLRVNFGPSFRLVIDVGDWDNSRFVNMPGQSGRVTNAHSTDHVQSWLDGTHAPLLFSRERIEAETVERLLLRPTMGAG